VCAIPRAPACIQITAHCIQPKVSNATQQCHCRWPSVAAWHNWHCPACLHQPLCWLGREIIPGVNSGWSCAADTSCAAVADVFRWGRPCLVGCRLLSSGCAADVLGLSASATCPTSLCRCPRKEEETAIICSAACTSPGSNNHTVVAVGFSARSFVNSQAVSARLLQLGQQLLAQDPAHQQLCYPCCCIRSDTKVFWPLGCTEGNALQRHLGHRAVLLARPEKLRRVIGCALNDVTTTVLSSL